MPLDSVVRQRLSASGSLCCGFLWLLSSVVFSRVASARPWAAIAFCHLTRSCLLRFVFLAVVGVYVLVVVLSTAVPAASASELQEPFLDSVRPGSSEARRRSDCTAD